MDDYLDIKDRDTRILEIEIRNRLTDEAIEEYFEKYKMNDIYDSFERTYRSAVSAFSKELLESVTDYKKIDEKRKKEINKKINKKADEIISKTLEEFKKPEKLVRTIRENFKYLYTSSEEIEAQLNLMSQEMKLDMGENVFKNFLEAFKPVIDYAKKKDEMVSKLAEIAKEKGIDEAMKKEVRYKLIREEYPTKEDYIEGIKSSYRSAKETTNRLKSSLMGGGEKSQMAYEIKAAEIFADFSQKEREKFLIETADEIYKS